MGKEKIWLSSPHMGEDELKNVQEAFATNWISPAGPFISLFEEQLAAYCGTNAAAVVQSGTAAIHLALRLLDIQEGDVVLCQSFTFVGSSNPILYEKATPVFVDSEKETWNMCPLALEEAIVDSLEKGQQPKAIIVVHLYGMPAKMPEIMALSQKYDIPVIEDAAEALGSTIKGKACGSFGDFGVLSFNGNKIITTSGGGALLSNNSDAIAKARFLATQAKDNAPHYQHSEIGYNYRMSNVAAAIGVGQLTVLAERVAARRANHDFYQALLGEVKGVYFLPEPEGYLSNRWLSCLLIDPQQTGGISREDVRLALEKENIECRPLWKPMHLQPLFAEARHYGSNYSEELFDLGLCLPSGSNLTDNHKQQIANQLKNVFSL
ncbi:aminotransferase class I/II-fold pyridoxal phosphate-dependent enzyme [Flavobacteriaceae bacterium]|nr:aminotransferase class I/II-fold pyridoxal phosphate-dependent enzyme [Flavobacteriaceae bacterium]